MPIQLSEHFTYSKLLRFTLPSVIMVIFTSIYSVIDGLFVSQFVGETPFAAVNIIWPFIMILGAIGFMFGSGGSALVAKTLGEGRIFKANRIFSLLIYATLILGSTFAVCGLLFIKPLVAAFGVEDALLDECMVYASILLPAVPMLMLQVIFQQFMSTAARPKLGLIITVVAGVANFGLDALFIIVWQWGVAGAAWATAASQIIGALVPLLYFIFPNKSLLHLGKTRFYFSALLKSASNGVSEFVSNISMSVVCMLYNYQLLRIVGQDGVVAYGIISYVTFIFWAAFIGYTIGSNPVVSFHFGDENKKELQSLWRKSLFLITISGVILTLLAELFAIPIAAVFIGYNDELTEMTAIGFRIYALSFLFVGFNIYASGFFTALNNGLISATIALMRTLIFECLCVLILPIFFGLNGIWCAIIVAEILAFIVSFGFFFKLKKRYGY